MKFNPEYRLHHIAGEDVALRQGDGGTDLTRIVQMNKTSLSLYNTFKGSDFSLEDVAHCLVSTYDLSEERAAEDAAKWVESLKNCGMIR